MLWWMRLGELDFHVEYKKGIKNPQADALSRLRFLGDTTGPIDEYIHLFEAKTSEKGKVKNSV